MPDTTLPYKPVIYSAPTFDVTQGCTITFTYLGGIVQSNTVTFRNNTTNAVVYTLTTTSNQLKCVIPANASGLSNGGVYNVTIQVRESATTVSQVSDPVIVYCFSTPTFAFDSVPATVSTSYLEVFLTYSQAQGEPLDRYNFTLYDINGQQKEFSGELYNTTTLSYVFYNLIDNESYSIKAVGVTQHNITVETTISFVVNYEEPSVYSLLGLENVPDAGAIKISPNVIIAEGTAYPSPPIFIDNSEIDLTAPNSHVDFDKGFIIDNDFVVQLIGTHFTPFTNVLLMKGKYAMLSLEYRTGSFASWSGEGDCGYFELKVNNYLFQYNWLQYY